MFNQAQILEGAAVDAAPGLPTTAGERVQSEASAAYEVYNGLAASRQLWSEYDSYLKEIEDVTGERLPNPFSERQLPRVRKQEQFVADRAAKLAEDFPDLRVRSPDGIRREIGEFRAGVLDRRALAAERTIDFPVSAAGLGASMGVTLADPVILSSMAIGAPWSAGILRTALVEAGIAMGAEAVVQTAVQTSRQQFGEEASLSEAMTAVATAGGGGFLLAGLIKGAGPAMRGSRDLLARARGLKNKSAEVEAAESFLERAVDEVESSPFPDTPKATAEHLGRLGEADAAVRAGRVADLPEADTLVRQVRGTPAASDDPAAQLGRMARDLAADRQRLDEQARGALEAVSGMTDEQLTVLHRELRAKPEKVETLLGFLSRRGIKEEGGELRGLGITPRSRPGLVRLNGQPLDEATLDAFEAGFFPAHTERPTTNDLLDAIREELHGRPVVRLEDEALLQDQTASAALEEGLSAAGADVRALKAGEFVPRVRQMARAATERLRGAEAARMSQAGADAADIEERLALMGEDDALAEADMRSRFAGREDEVIVIENEDGVKRLTVRELQEGFERDADDLAALKACGNV